MMFGSILNCQERMIQIEDTKFEKLEYEEQNVPRNKSSFTYSYEYIIYSYYLLMKSCNLGRRYEMECYITLMFYLHKLINVSRAFLSSPHKIETHTHIQTNTLT